MAAQQRGEVEADVDIRPSFASPSPPPPPPLSLSPLSSLPPLQAHTHTQPQQGAGRKGEGDAELALWVEVLESGGHAYTHRQDQGPGQVLPLVPILEEGVDDFAAVVVAVEGLLGEEEREIV